MLDSARLRTLLSLIISAGLLFYLYTEYFSEVRNLDIRWAWFALGAAVSLTINYGLGAYKWHCVLKLHGIHLPRAALIKIWIGIFSLAFVFPFQTGHLLFARAVEKCGGTTFGLGFRAMVFDKGLNVLATLLLVVIGQLILDPSHPVSHPLILIGAALPLLAFFFLNLQGIGRRLPSSWTRPKRWLSELDLQLRFGQKLRLLILAGFYQGTDVLSAVIAGFAISQGADPLAVIGAFPLVVLVSYLPAAFQGLGAREALSVLWLSSTFTQAESATLGFLVSMLEYGVPAIFGLSCLKFTIDAVSGKAEESSGQPPPTGSSD